MGVGASAGVLSYYTHTSQGTAATLRSVKRAQICVHPGRYNRYAGWANLEARLVMLKERAGRFICDTLLETRRHLEP